MATWYLWHVGGELVAITEQPQPPQDIDGRVMTEMELLDKCEAPTQKEAEAIFQSRHPSDTGDVGNVPF